MKNIKKMPAKECCKKDWQRKLPYLCMEKKHMTEAIETTEKLFANQTAPAESLSIEDLEGMEGVVKIDFPKKKLLKVLMLFLF